MLYGTTLSSVSAPFVQSALIVNMHKYGRIRRAHMVVRYAPDYLSGESGSRDITM